MLVKFKYEGTTFEYKNFVSAALPSVGDTVAGHWSSYAWKVGRRVYVYNSDPTYDYIEIDLVDKRAS